MTFSKTTKKTMGGARLGDEREEGAEGAEGGRERRGVCHSPGSHCNLTEDLLTALFHSFLSLYTPCW